MKYAIVLISFLLGGCVTDGLSPTQIEPICKALIGPIHYNSTNKASKRYAAALLALDLHQRNIVGQQLGCPQYRVHLLGATSMLGMWGGV